MNANNNIRISREKYEWNRKSHSKRVKSHLYLSEFQRQKIAEMIQNGEIESASSFVRKLLDDFLQKRARE